MTSPATGAWNRSTAAECHHRDVVEPEVPEVRPVRRRRSTSPQPATSGGKRSKRAARRAEPLAGTTPLVRPPLPPGAVRIRRRGRIRRVLRVLGDHPVGLVAVVVVVVVLIGAIVGAKVHGGERRRLPPPGPGRRAEPHPHGGDDRRTSWRSTQGCARTAASPSRPGTSPTSSTSGPPRTSRSSASNRTDGGAGSPSGASSAEVTTTGVHFRVPKTACVRVAVPNA